MENATNPRIEGYVPAIGRVKSFTPGANDFVYLSMRTNRYLMSIPAINTQIRALAASRGVRLIDLVAHTCANNG